MSELTKRIIIASIGIPLIILVVILGNIYFFIFVTIISTIALYEFYIMSRNKNHKPSKIIALIYNFCILLLLYCYSIDYICTSIFIKYIIILSLIAIVLILIQQLFYKENNIYDNFGTTIAGLLYITVPMCILLLLRFKENIKGINNAYFILIMLFTIWICDTFAYFIGKKFGKRKLLERVSPKKTIAGFIAGFIASFIFFFIVTIIIMPQLKIIHSIFLAVIIGITGQLGDLIESKFKRDANVKDSSSIIPGHGGVLDRFDSFIFTIIVTYIYIVIFID